MRYHCYFCGKSVTSELPNDSIIRAIHICPECIGEGRMTFPDENTNTDPERARYRGNPIDYFPDTGE